MLDDASLLANSDPVLFYRYNNAQRRFFNSLKNPKKETLTITLLLKGNRAGGSWALVSAWSALMFGTSHPNLQGHPFGSKWPFVKSARLAAPIGTLGDKGPIQTAISQLFPFNQYIQRRGTGKGYYSEGMTDTGWTWDVITYDQASLQAAGANKGLILMSEPPPQDIFTECLTRLSGNGMMIAEFTRLDLADYIDDYVDAGALILDGKKVGEVRTVTADIHDSCREHSNGHQAHSAIESAIAGWPSEEREARKTGKALSRSGRIYNNWSDANEITKFDKYQQDCWEKEKVIISNVVNPHDRPPWPIAWFATFPNDDVVVFAEWPPFAWHESKSSPITHYEDYRGIILEAESQMYQIKNRIMDPLFGEAINTQTGFNLFAIMAGRCLQCQRNQKRGITENASEEEKERVGSRCKHSLIYRHGVAYPGSVNAGHILVRAAIGDPDKGIRPKLFAFKDSCPNFCYAQRRYAFREHKDKTKGLSDRPQYINKEVADLVRLFYLSGLNKYPAEPEDLKLGISPWAARNALKV